MTTELLIALIAFAFVSSITPGPNNLMLMASGANYGFQRTIPHMLGVGLGFTLMVILVGAGLMEIFDRYTFSYTVLKTLSVIYLSYLALRIATATAPVSHSGPTHQARATNGDAEHDTAVVADGGRHLSARPSSGRPLSARPFTFMQAVLFQWVNPKAWTMALTAISVYSPDRHFESVVYVALIFGAVNLPCVSTWTIVGQQVRRFLSSRRQLRVFNITMASLLILSLYPVVFN